MKGDVVRTAAGEQVVLDDVGQRVLLETPSMRVWDIALLPEEGQPWHHHHNPYVILSLSASPARMDWLDGSPARYVDEYVGGSVYRPIGPVHRLTNVGDARYRNRLVEFRELGENRPDPVDVGSGERSTQGQRPDGGPLPDGRELVLVHAHTTVWLVDVPGGGRVTLQLREVPHVVAALEAPDLAEAPSGGVLLAPGGPFDLVNPSATGSSWFVVELSHLAGDPAGPVSGGHP